MNVDGLKTGHTSGAGFNLIASAVDGQRRLIAVVMGADSPKGREQQAAKLLHWVSKISTPFRCCKGQKVGSERIWYGDKEQIQLGTDQDFWLARRSRKCRVLKPCTCWTKDPRRPLPQINGSGKSHSMMATKWSRTGRW